MILVGSLIAANGVDIVDAVPDHFAVLANSHCVGDRIFDALPPSVCLNEGFEWTPVFSPTGVVLTDEGAANPATIRRK